MSIICDDCQIKKYVLNGEKYENLPTNEKKSKYVFKLSKENAESEEKTDFLYHQTFVLKNDIFENINKGICDIHDDQLKEKLNKFIKGVSDIIDSINIDGDIPIPPINFSFNQNDQAVFLEWIFSEFRVGFIVSADSEFPSWYLISIGDEEENSSYGKLSDEKFGSVITKILMYILGNT